MEKSIPTKTIKETTLDSKVRGRQGAKRKSRKVLKMARIINVCFKKDLLFDNSIKKIV